MRDQVRRGEPVDDAGGDRDRSGGAGEESLSSNERLRRANDALRARMERQASQHAAEGAQRLGEAGDALLLASRQLRQALDMSREGLALFAEDGRFLAVNARFSALFPDVAPRFVPGQRYGDAARALCGSAFLALDVGERAALAAALAAARSGGREGEAHPLVAGMTDGRRVEFVLRRPAGGALAIGVCDVTGVVEGAASHGFDAAEAEAEAEAATGAGRWPDAVLDRLPVGVAACDPTGGLLRCNAPFRALLGLGLADAQEGANIVSLIEADAAEPVVRALVAWLASETPREMLPVDLARGNGRVLRLSCHGDAAPPLQNAGRHWGGFTAQLVDVTDDVANAEALARVRRTLESRVVDRTAALTDLNDRLVQEVAERRAIDAQMRSARDAAEAANLSKTRFLAAASHDLLQPLNAARLFLSALSASRLSAEATETVGQIESAFTSVETLLNALLDISKLDAGSGEAHVVDFPISRILKPVADEFGPVAQQRGRKLRVAPCSATVRSDPQYLRRIVQNLVSNALKYTVTGGVVVGCRRRGGTLRIEVWDSGVGLGAAERHRVFEEFHRIDAANPRGERGMGLGLAIVERAARLLGHRVDVRSEPGVGSVFSVTAPLGSAAAVSRSGAIALSETPRGADIRGMIALVLDDDDAVRGATSALLARWGVDSMESSTAGQAVAAVRQLGMEPDIMLLDYHLADGLNGLQALRRLREETGVSAPAVIITADRSRALQMAVAELGAELLSKPVAPAKLRALLQWIRVEAKGFRAS